MMFIYLSASIIIVVIIRAQEFGRYLPILAALLRLESRSLKLGGFVLSLFFFHLLRCTISSHPTALFLHRHSLPSSFPSPPHPSLSVCECLLFFCLTLSPCYFLATSLLLPPTGEVRQHVDARRPAPLALGLADQHQVVPRGLVPAVVVVAAVLDGEGGGDLLAVVADDLGQGPELLLLVGGHPSLDDYVVGVLKKSILVSTFFILFFFTFPFMLE